MKVKLLLVIPLFVMFCGALRADTIEQFTVTAPAALGYGGPFTTEQTWVFQIQQNPMMSMPFVTGIPGGGVNEGFDGGFEIDNVPAIHNGTLLENLSIYFFYPGDYVAFECNPTWACAWDIGKGGEMTFNVPVINWSDGPTINEGVFTSTTSSIFGGDGFPTASVVPLGAVPEPTTALMLAFGLLMLPVLRRWLPLDNSGFRS